MAFVSPVQNTTFVGSRVPANRHVCVSVPHEVPAATTTMSYGMDKMLSKYNAMSTAKPDPPAPQEPSSVWTTFLKYTALRFLPTRTRSDASMTYEEYMAVFRLRAARPFAPGGKPSMIPGETYMASCVTKQYKQTACPTGVYSVTCTEGTTRGQAELSRVASLASDFRLGQRSTSQKFQDMYTTRIEAATASHQCSYEEGLTNKFGVVAGALVRGQSEVMGACPRYAVGGGLAEEYMVGCVDKQSKMRAVPYGVYDVMCNDGSVSGMAENKRIVAESAKFRIGQLPPLAKAQRMFDVRQNAIHKYAHMCSYEEELFLKYPGVSSAMRSSNVRY